MTHPKKYKMRPTRKKPGGGFQQVPIGFIKGRLSALASEGTHEVSPAIHRAYMAGDIDIDDYPHERKSAPAKKQPKKRKPKAKEESKEESPNEPVPLFGDAEKSEAD